MRAAAAIVALLVLAVVALRLVFLLVVLVVVVVVVLLLQLLELPRLRPALAAAVAPLLDVHASEAPGAGADRFEGRLGCDLGCGAGSPSAPVGRHAWT